MRGYSWLIAVAALCMLAVPAFADSKEEVEDGTVAMPLPETLANCDLTGYKSFQTTFTTPLAIPDNSPAGVTTPNLATTADGTNFTDVILQINAAHTWVGDLVVDLVYDPDCDPATANVSQRIVCRPRGNSAQAPAPCNAGVTGFGCSSNLICANTYRFTDAIGTAIGEQATACVDATNIASGCFRPSTQGAGTFAAFNGLPKGGCFRMTVSDNAAADTGTICGWGVHVLNSATPNAAASWGSVKTLYR
jgi:hypothetical protein